MEYKWLLVFVTTHECRFASIKFTSAYIDAKQEIKSLSKSPVEMPAEPYANEFIAEFEAGNKTPLKCPLIIALKTARPKAAHYCIALDLMERPKGDL
jgi:hypothetical protein